MLRFNIFARLHIRDGSGQLEQTVVCAHANAKRLKGLFQQHAGIPSKQGRFSKRGSGKLAITINANRAITLPLPFPCSFNDASKLR
ncbi:hypothetical protein D3C85_1652430 [compost metagenome]